MKTNFIFAAVCSCAIAATPSPHKTISDTYVITGNEKGPAHWVQTISIEDIQDHSKEQLKRFASLMKDGIFYLKMPEGWAHHLDSADRFANAFYKSPAIKEIELPSHYGGYSPKKDQQIESYYTELEDWPVLKECGLYDDHIYQLATDARSLGIEIIGKCFKTAGVPEGLWSPLSGYAYPDKEAGRRGSYHFSYNHYRNKHPGEGLKGHLDFGFLTILFINKAGLQVWRHDGWWDIPPKEGHVVINFGRGFEWAIPDDRLTAIFHRVKRMQYEDRTSFALFVDHDINAPIYRCHSSVEDKTVEFETGQAYADWSFGQAYGE